MTIRKGSRLLKTQNGYRTDRKRKRVRPPNQWLEERGTSATHFNVKKFKKNPEMKVLKDPALDYRVLDYKSVFRLLSKTVQCKKCESDVKFTIKNTVGLGFEIVVSCDECNETTLSSCPQTGSAYEINNRFCFAMQNIGQSYQGARKFCGLMDLPPPVTDKPYTRLQEHIHDASKAVVESIMKDAGKEEQIRTSAECGIENTIDVAVSGDRSWQKRGFSSNYGVTSIIGALSKKVVDIDIKSTYCQECELWNKKKGSAEYDEWKEQHGNDCCYNHDGSEKHARPRQSGER